jgi:transposase
MMFNALHLAGWDVLSMTRLSDATIIRAAYPAHPSSCPRCHADEPPVRRGTVIVDYTDAPMFGDRAILRAVVQRFACKHCKHVFRQKLPDIDPVRTMTARCIAYVGEQARIRTFSDVARIVGIDEKTVRQIAAVDAADRISERQFVAPVVLGIDELTLAGAKRCIFTDVGEHRVLDLLPTMDRAAVQIWLERLPGKERIRVVTIDMHAPYKGAVRAALPGATIVVDKWHIQREADDALNRTRARLAQGLRGKEKRQVMRGRRLLHARGEHLPPAARAILARWLDDKPTLRDAWEAKEAFYAIWDGRLRSDRERLYSEWHGLLITRWRDVLEDFAPILWAVRNWRTEIFAYYRAPFTNAYTEAANGIIKIANRMGRGYTFSALRARALLAPNLAQRQHWVCEGCLGQFAYDSRGAQEAGSERVCSLCAAVAYLIAKPKRSSPKHRQIRRSRSARRTA